MMRGGPIAMNNQAKMQVKLIDYASDPLEKLYAAFRTCYSADTPIEIWEKIKAEKISHDKIREFIAERLKTGHASPLEQVVFWFGISGVSRSLSHQFVRHRIGISFEQQSQRYVKFKQDKLAFVLPESWSRAGLDDEFSQLLERTSELYTRALKAGIPAEDARFILPNAAPTNFQVMVNFA
jgi:thymidylate synthase (FAD)